MKRPSNDAWYETQVCGPLFVVFCVRPNDDDDATDVKVTWWICSDNEDKNRERALATNEDAPQRGHIGDLDKLIEIAMAECSKTLLRIVQEIVAFLR